VADLPAMFTSRGHHKTRRYSTARHACPADYRTTA
jgi:hypothetical protein